MASPRRTYDDSDSDGGDFNPAPADGSDDEQQPSSPIESRNGARRSSPSRDDNDADGDANGDSHSVRDDDEGEEDEDNTGARKARDEDEDDEDEDDDDDEDEDDMPQHRRKRRKGRDTRAAFFDMEAEVDEDEDDVEDEEDQAEIGDFIDQSHPDELAEAGDVDDERYHRELDRRKQMEENVGAEEVAERLKRDYGRKNAYSGRGALTDSAVVPKRLLLPSVHDPSIWAVKCKEGKENEVVMAIQKKYEESIGTDHELAITSAFERGGPNSVMKGYIYVEGYSSIDVQKSLADVMNVYPHTKMFLIEIKDMPDLLRVQPPPKLTPGTWVRIKRPKLYEGDLAQVLDITDTGLDAAVKIIPRVDYSNREDKLAAEKANGFDKDGKRKRPGFFAKPRPPQRLFSEVEARKRNPAGLSLNPLANTFTYKNEEYSKGFLHKHIKIQHLVTTNVNPTLEEVTKFASSDEKDGAENLDLKALAVSLKDSSANVAYLPGDIVEVFKGEQKGVIGKATNVVGDIVTIAVTEGELEGQSIDIPTSSLRKRFKLGDHVKVTSLSRYEGEVGMVVKISDDRVTFLTDQNNTEITVFSKDLREASDISGQGSLGQYALLDLVQLDVTTVGCIVKVDRESLVVLDQNGSTRQVMPSQIANKIPKRKHTIAADRNGSEIRLDDVVKEYGGQQRQGKIIHIHRSFVYLHNNESNENAGVFVTRSSSLMTVAAKGGRVAGGPDLTQMNPAAKRDPSGNSSMAAPPKQSFGRDRSIGQTVTIKKGGWKGLLGIVKDTTDTHARVELHTKGKIVTVPKVDLVFKDKITGRTIDINGRGGGFGGRGGFSGGRGGGVDLGFGSRTPQISSGSERTPAWGASSRATARTPAWSQGPSAGSRTPAWGDGSRTVNPYDGSRTAYGSGSRTPAWSSGAKTPAHDGFSLGSKTPAYASGGGDSAWGAGSKTPAYGISAPTPGASDPWGPTPSAYDAPTPGGLGAPTPGAALNAPTPGAFNAPTPGALNAPTPAAWSGGWGADSAPTPAAGAPTPGASGGYYSAPTPVAYGSAETPAASGPRYTDDD
ncbi:transcription initiation protein spt5 [Diaporthe amygdali]|uniref:transcription initiation protein spt5 n=1 Tax=Phomopsis amygdali TaxID=1214568 RepID=UPI0022FE5497|nr:transcription initiation protein spt5 [Diaporthe amygdali]KAJ0122328.1 transcription initiation protein spt5 [Diaporthe amygdali]